MHREYCFSLSDEDAKQKFMGESWHVKIRTMAEQTTQSLNKDEEQYKTEMVEEQAGFGESLDDLSNAVNGFEQFTDISNVEFVVGEAKTIYSKLREAEKQAQVYNSRETLLGLEVSDYSCLKKISEKLDPFLNFWTVVSSWKVSSSSTVHYTLSNTIDNEDTV